MTRGNVVTNKSIRIGAVLALLLVQTGFASAAELKVFSTIAVEAAMKELIPVYEKESGNKLDITFGTAAGLTKRVQDGESADALILTPPLLQGLTKDGKAAPAVTPLVSSGVAVVVKNGAAKPDISTADAFKAAVLHAKSIAYSDPAAGGASGVYVAKLLERLGLTEAVKDKTKHPPAGGNAANLVVSGDAELAIQQTPEVMGVKGAEIVGTLPGDLNNVTTFAIGMGAETDEGDAVRALIKFLQSPEATAVFKAKGLDPA
jgi:molybdate transport system substrate-binding protein